tara:strand:+ start:760 stop:1458 length:699 start_codon:yes stop_codon:yes gene_type:complete
MKTAIMQPYFLPYLGYFQLINSVDIFILYDNIKYTKKGWINRNRILQNGKDIMFSLPLKSDSDFLDVRDRQLTGDFSPDKLLNQIRGGYRLAPNFAKTFLLIEQIMRYEERNLFKFIHHSIFRICEHLGITTEIKVSSSIAIDHLLKSQDKVIAICEAVDASTYINPIGGMELYSKNAFAERELELEFIKSKPYEYSQFGNGFVPWLSIIDVMMFNSLDALRESIDSGYELI